MGNNFPDTRNHYSWFITSTERILFQGWFLAKKRLEIPKSLWCGGFDLSDLVLVIKRL